jgi:hypothetical protein
MTDAELEAEHKLAHDKSIAANAGNGAAKASVATNSNNHPALTVMAWALVLVPISYGVWSTIQKTWVLFN